MAKRVAFFVYGAVAYAIFFGTFLYAIAFVGGFLVPTQLDGPAQEPVALSLAIDAALLTIFAVQHSVMARPGFKAWWTKIVPPPIERSVFVLSASIALMILFLGWRPIDAIVWNVTNPILKDLIWILFWAGWLTVLVSTFLINHFELFGLQQAWLHVRGREAARPELRQPGFYRWVAHPLYSGFFLAFWAAPEMTAGHLLLAAGVSIYMLIAIRYEERDLTDFFGDEYRRYRSGVGMLTPRFRRPRRESPTT
jgi:protein-S-isoprenylcysteine O-methyltransferase Ste14